MISKKTVGLIVSAFTVVVLIVVCLNTELTKHKNDDNSIVDSSDGTKKLDFTSDLIKLDETVVPMKEYQGKILVLNFWASWCKPCHTEATELKAFYEGKNEQAELLAINAISVDSRKNAMKFLALYDLDFPVFLDKEKSLENSFQILTYPTTLIFDTDGTMKYKIQGPIEHKQLNALIEKL